MSPPFVADVARVPFKGFKVKNSEPKHFSTLSSPEGRIEGGFKSSGFAPAKAVVLLVKSSAFTGQKQCFSNAPMTPTHATAPLLR